MKRKARIYVHTSFVSMYVYQVSPGSLIHYNQLKAIRMNPGFLHLLRLVFILFTFNSKKCKNAGPRSPLRPEIEPGPHKDHNYSNVAHKTFESF